MGFGRFHCIKALPMVLYWYSGRFGGVSVVREASCADAPMQVASHEAKKGEFKKCLLLYSGGLDTCAALQH